MSIWQISAEPSVDCMHPEETDSKLVANGYATRDAPSDCESCLNDGDDEYYEPDYSTDKTDGQRLVLACDDGCIRMYKISDKDGFIYSRSFPRVSGQTVNLS